MAEHVSSPVIRAAALFAAYASPSGTVVALQGLSLELTAGEMTALVGPSGSGKSTLLACLAGRQPALSGRLESHGVPLHDASARAIAAYRRSTVALVRQHYTTALSPDLSVDRIVSLRPRLLGWSRRAARTRASELLDRVGLADRAGVRRTELSGGEQQRVALCAALAARPRLLLADEPTGQLDDASGATLLGLLRAVAREEGATVVLGTHDPRAVAVVDRTVTIRDGRVTGELLGGGRHAVAIDGSGVLRLDAEDRERSGLGDRALLEHTPAGLLLRSENRPIGQIRPHTPPARPLHTADEDRPPLVSIRNLGRRYGAIRALDGIDLDIHAGLLTVLSGPSGGGKTTLLSVIGGLDRPTEGFLHVCGEDLATLSRDGLAALRRSSVAIVPQSVALVDFLSAAENIELALTARGVPAGTARSEARESLAAVGLAEVAGRPSGGLSAGQRQRVAVARACAARPRLLLADEPTANLDEHGAAAVAGLLAAAAHERGTAVLCSTHDPTVERIADRLQRVRDGRLEGPLESSASA